MANNPAPPAEVDEPLVSTPSDPSFLAAVSEEYGQLVAAGPISYFGAPAFAAGAPVPASHPCVPQWLADGSVVRVGG